MKTRIFIYAMAVALGAAVGRLLVPSPGENHGSTSEVAVAGARASARQHQSGRAWRIQRLLAVESGVLRRDITFKEARSKLDSEDRSPLRLRSFIDHRVHFLSKDQLVRALAVGELTSTEDLAEAARRLVHEDRHVAFDVYMKRAFRPRTMEQVYAYVHSMLWHWVRKEPESLLKRIQGMSRGGSQQDTSLTFSSYWANHDPAAAARHFNELVILRNMYDHKQGEMTSASYSRTVVDAWLKKDADAVRAYVASLPEGGKKKHFQNALDRHSKGKR